MHIYVHGNGPVYVNNYKYTYDSYGDDGDDYRDDDEVNTNEYDTESRDLRRDTPEYMSSHNRIVQEQNHQSTENRSTAPQNTSIPQVSWQTSPVVTATGFINNTRVPNTTTGHIPTSAHIPLQFNVDTSGTNQSIQRLITDVFQSVLQLPSENIQVEFSNEPSTRQTSVNSLFEGSTLIRPTEDMLNNENVACAICHNTYSESDILRKLNACNHVFHAHCLERWFTTHDNCPVCRQRLVENS